MNIEDAHIKQANKINRKQKSGNGDKSDQQPLFTYSFKVILSIIALGIVAFLSSLEGYDMYTYTASLSTMYIYAGLCSGVVLLLVILGVYYLISSCISVKQALGTVDRKLSDNKYMHMYRVSISDKVSRKKLVSLGRLAVVYILILLTSFIMVVLGRVLSNPQFCLPYYIFADFVGGVETETLTYVSDTYIVSSTSHSRGKSSVRSYELRYSYWVNFQTSSGEIMTIQTSGDHIDDFRTFDNTEISYYPRTKTYVSSN